MEKVEIIFFVLLPKRRKCASPASHVAVSGTKQILTVRATESTQEWTNPKRAEEQKILWHTLVNIISETRREYRIEVPT